jgi:conjugal transfer pilus assembly protein TraD
MNREQIVLAVSLLFTLCFVYGGPSLLKIFPLLFKFTGRLLGSSFSKNSDGGKITIGNIELTDSDRVRHTHIVGATGSGKTVLLESLIYEDIRQGRGAFIIDPKGDRELFDRIKKFTKEIGRESDLHLLSAVHQSESARWNPCRLGTASEIQSKILNCSTFSEPFYQKACESSLLAAVTEAVKENPHFHLPHLLSRLKDEKNEHVQGLHFDFFNLINTEWKEILCAAPPEKTTREISLLDIIRKNEILFVDLPTEGKSVQSTKIGKLLLQEIMLVSGLRKTFPELRSRTPFSVFIDEFDAFATESFATFQNKARSSNFMIHLAHQTLSDLDEVGPNFKNKILGNTNIRFVFRQDIPEDAETWASFFGTKLVVKSTFRSTDGQETGEASNRLSKEFRIHPDEIKELGVGECISSVKSSRTLKHTKVPLPRERKILRPLERPAHNYSLAFRKPEFKEAP